jgi:predicted PurR-regulated permease PerM
MPEQSSGPLVTYAVPGWLIVVVAVPVIIGLLYFGRDFLVPIAIALLLFVLTAALVDRIGSAKIAGWSPPRWLAHISGIAIVLFGFVTIAVILSSEANDFIKVAPRYAERFQNLIEKIEFLLGAQIIGAVERAIAEVDVGVWLSSLAGSASGFLASVSLVMIYLVFLFAERQAFTVKLPLMAADQAEVARISGVLHSISDSVKQYMWINAVTSAMSGAVAYVIFRLVGLDFAATLALIVFMAGFIPTIGALIGITLPSLVALMQFDTLTPFLIVLLGYGGADQLIANVIQPAMQGKSLNLSTFMVMISLSFWGSIWGGIGAFLAVPMMVIVMIICGEIPALRPIAILFSGDGELMRPDDA